MKNDSWIEMSYKKISSYHNETWASFQFWQQIHKQMQLSLAIEILYSIVALLVILFTVNSKAYTCKPKRLRGFWFYRIKDDVGGLVYTSPDTHIEHS